MRFHCVALALLAVLCGSGATPTSAGDKPIEKVADKHYVCEAKISAPARIQEHRLFVAQPETKKEGAAYLWDVTPEDVADVIQEGDRLILTAPPGVYRIRLTMLEVRDGKLLRPQVCRHTLTIERSGQPPVTPPGPGTPPVTPKPDNTPKPNPAKALGRIQFGNAGCTATPIWPRRSDGKWDIITAAHCMPAVGSRGTFTTQSGERIPVRVTAHERGSDLAWLVTESPVETLEYAVLAKEMPTAGTKVWHAGYGVDRPGNREEGELVNPEAGQNQATYMISVSSGDSGGGIFNATTGEWLGAVCCTRAKGVRATVWAGHAVRAAALRPRVGVDDAKKDNTEYTLPRGAEHPILLDEAKGEKPEVQAVAPRIHPVELCDPATGRIHPILVERR